MPTTRIAHLTDPHTTSLVGVHARDLLGKRVLGYLSWRRKRRYQHSQQMLEATTRAALAEGPDAVVITGDLMHIGLQQEMREIRPWLERLADQLPVLLVPGNHDLYSEDSLAHWQRELSSLPVFGEAVSSNANWPRVLNVNQVRIVGLASAYPAPLTRADGKLGASQRNNLEQLLAATGGQHRTTLLALHHPADPGLAKQRKSLLDAGELQQLLKQSRQPVSVLAHGHLHQNLSYQVGATKCFCTASASSLRADAPASFRLFEFGNASDDNLNTSDMNCRLFEAKAPAAQPPRFVEIS